MSDKDTFRLLMTALTVAAVLAVLGWGIRACNVDQCRIHCQKAGLVGYTWDALGSQELGTACVCGERRTAREEEDDDGE